MGDVCDNCKDISNPKQKDNDNDGLGDLCEDDIDNDGVLNKNDNCPDESNPKQTDSDNDGLGDACDNCPNKSNPGQEDKNQNLIGDVCDGGADKDRDGVPDDLDNCPSVSNFDQLDTDKDGKYQYIFIIVLNFTIGDCRSISTIFIFIGSSDLETVNNYVVSKSTIFDPLPPPLFVVFLHTT